MALFLRLGLVVAAAAFAPAPRPRGAAPALPRRPRAAAAAAAAARRPRGPRAAPSEEDYGGADAGAAAAAEGDDSFIYPGGMVQAQDEYGQWYVSEVVETRGAGASLEVLVKYLGWEDWPPEWLPRARVAFAPKVRPPVPDEMLTPEELAARLEGVAREKAMYQCQKFREAFAGRFDVCEGGRYVADAAGARLAATFGGSLAVACDDDDDAATAYDGWRVRVSEARTAPAPVDGAAAPGDAGALGDVALRPSDFGGAAPAGGAGAVGGVAANGEAFSCARAAGGVLTAEVWMAAAGRLLQCRVVYEDGAFSHCDVARRVGRKGFKVARYAAAGVDAAADPRAPPGTGVFDVHRRLREAAARGAVDGGDDGVLEVRLGGRATCAFPRRLAADGGGCVSLDWVAPGASIRVQVDRVFDAADGSIASLEITDVLADDADKYGGVYLPKEI